MTNQVAFASPLTTAPAADVKVGNVVWIHAADLPADELLQVRIIAISEGANPLLTVAVRGLSVPAPYRVGDQFFITADKIAA